MFLFFKDDLRSGELLKGPTAGEGRTACREENLRLDVELEADLWRTFPRQRDQKENELNPT